MKVGFQLSWVGRLRISCLFVLILSLSKDEMNR